MRDVVAIAAVAACLAGCSHSINRPERTMAVAAPQQWSAGELPDGPPQSQWWAYFGDAGLDKAISTTLTHNKNLAAAAARIDAAQAQARIAGAAALPDLNAGFSRTRQHINFVGFPIPGAGDRILSSTSTQLGLSLNLSWEADVWGRVKAGRIAALSDLQAVEADLAGVQLSLTGQATKAWFAAIEAKRQVLLAKASLESYEVSSRRVRARFNSGIRPSLDLRLALTEVSRAASLLQQRRQQLDATLRQLEILMGRYPAAEYALAEDLPNTPRGLPAGLPSELVHRRPDLAAAERRLLGADARIAQAKTDLRPRFNLTGSSGTTTNKLRQVLSGDVFVWSLIGGLTQPIFNNGRLKATVKQSEAMAREAAANYEDAILRAYGEVETALAADAHLEGQEQALEEATRLAMAAQGLAEQRYRSGLADITTMLQAQRTALDAESSLLSIRRARLDNRVDLHLALGGDFTMTAPSRVASGPEPRKTL